MINSFEKRLQSFFTCFPVDFVLSLVLGVSKVSQQLGPEKSKGMLFFHAFSGCDTVSGFRYKKKKSFLQTWNVFPEVTNTFQKLSRNTNTIEDVDI